MGPPGNMKARVLYQQGIVMFLTNCSIS